MLAKLLFWFTATLPCRIINRKPGEPYLERYWLFSLFGITAYLHRFVAADIDEGPHDHPWDIAIAWVLAGGYTEQRGHIHPKKCFDGHDRPVKRGRINLILGHHFHRIIEAKPETWTLFIHTKHSQPWGFILEPLADPNALAAPIYHQPFSTNTKGWHLEAPTGEFAGREPFNGAGQ